MVDADLIAFDIFDAAVAGAAAGPKVAAEVARLPLSQKNRVWVFALGKAAHAMAAGAVEAIRGSMVGIAGGLIVGPDRAPSPHPTIEVMTGEHPIPGRGSFAAAERLGELARGMRSTDGVIVLVSGGATSLVAAPVKGVAEAELTDLYKRLFARGLTVAEMNAVRKRFSRWGGGRLAVAVAPATTWCFVVSDVVSDRVEAVGSGPCAPDPTTATEVQEMLERAGLYHELPSSMRTILELTPRGRYAETPKPRHPAFAHVASRVVVNNRDALHGAAAEAEALGYQVSVMPEPLTGEASQAGERIAGELLARRRALAAGAKQCVLWGGETTVTLRPPQLQADRRGRPTPMPPVAIPPGGRCQELALAAAGALDAGGDEAEGITILAAGTDGRDGTTDAAGARIDRASWRAIRDAGIDPARALAAHDAHTALREIGALLRPGSTGTNVMDVVIGLVHG